MDSTVAGGLFALGGVALTSLFGGVGWIARRHGDRKDAAAEDARRREERLFQHKVDSYTAFLEEFTRMESAIASHTAYEAPPPDDALFGLLDLAVPVQMHGSADAAHAAMNLCGLVAAWLDAAGGEASIAAAQRTAKGKTVFLNAVRADVGSGGPI